MLFDCYDQQNIPKNNFLLLVSPKKISNKKKLTLLEAVFRCSHPEGRAPKASNVTFCDSKSRGIL